MKKTIICSLIALILLVVLPPLVLRFPLWKLGAAVEVATGLGAKLACSGLYISGFDQQRIDDDLASYSPATRLLDYAINEQAQSVTTTLWNMNPTTAIYRQGLGCSLDIGGSDALSSVSLPVLSTPSERLAWPKGNRVDTINPALQQRLDQLLAEDNEQGLDTRALLVVKDGRIQAEAYAPGFDHQTPLLGWSMGKTITAMLVGNLIQQGKLSLSDTQLFSQWQQDTRSDISLKNLLTMTSGLDFDETYTPGTDSTKMLFSAHSASDVALGSAPAHTPGSYFSYSSGTTNILARLVFEKSGGTAQSHFDHLHQALISPLNLSSLVFEPDASGVVVGSSYIYASARDWAKLGQLVLNQGELNGHRVFSPEFAEQMAMPNGSENEPRYGFQAWLNQGGDALRWDDIPVDAFAMRGNRSQIVLMVPSLNIVIVRLGWTSGWYSANDKLAPLLTTDL